MSDKKIQNGRAVELELRRVLMRCVKPLKLLVTPEEMACFKAYVLHEERLVSTGDDFGVRFHGVPVRTMTPEEVVAWQAGGMKC